MLIPLLAALQIASVQAPAPPSGAPPTDPPVYSGRANQLRVPLPRVEAEVEIDGDLGDAPWSRAAVLTGFSQYRPVDGGPAADSTEILVWYSPQALYIGIRAFEPHAPVNATLADRDDIFGDDYVQIYLDTFDEGRRAFVFAVNPLGVQADGTISEDQGSDRSWFSGEAAEGGRRDLNPDFLFDSEGRVADRGYEVEVRIPFKSMRYPSTDPQRWGIHVLRSVQHAGEVQSWVPVRRGTTSMLGQAGSLAGLTDLRRGLVLDVNPVATTQVVGAPADDGWSYDGRRPEFGLNARWGITTDLALNGTVNPDFSQVEADVAQTQFDPRQAVFFPEKRPFFLESSEQFSAPNGLIYTRRIVDPIAAAKVSGRVADLDVGFISAVDDAGLSATGDDRPVYNILRVRRSIGEQSHMAATYTDRVEGADYNRVASIDSRIVLGGRHTLSAQIAGSATRTNGATAWAPLWDVGIERSGRDWGWEAGFRGVHPDFEPGSGFISRGSVVTASARPRITRYGGPDSRVESWSGAVNLYALWEYDRFTGRDMPPDESKLHLNSTLLFRGGWRLGTSVLIEQFRYPERLYTDYAIEATGPAGTDTVPFVGRPAINNYDLVVSLGTPRFPTLSADGFFVIGRDENFPEWAPGYILWAVLNGTWRPTDRVRVDGRYSETRVLRPSDRSVVSLTQLPRLKVEYQVARPLFVRVVGQYVARRQDALRDDGRTNAPILIRDTETGVYERATARSSNDFRFDWLVSYRPSPGTVIFAGYGSSLAEDRAFRFRDLSRTGDGFFLKVSYLFRI